MGKMALNSHNIFFKKFSVESKIWHYFFLSMKYNVISGPLANKSIRNKSSKILQQNKIFTDCPIEIFKNEIPYLDKPGKFHNIPHFPRNRPRIFGPVDSSEHQHQTLVVPSLSVAVQRRQHCLGLANHATQKATLFRTRKSCNLESNTVQDSKFIQLKKQHCPGLTIHSTQKATLFGTCKSFNKAMRLLNSQLSFQHITVEKALYVSMI